MKKPKKLTEAQIAAVREISSHRPFVDGFSDGRVIERGTLLAVAAALELLGYDEAIMDDVRRMLGDEDPE
jgi:hypothetical protein